jgi:hypothetical protein
MPDTDADVLDLLREIIFTCAVKAGLCKPSSRRSADT